MTNSNSTAPTRARKPHKPDKPHKDFPLTAHPCGLWCKKVRGKLYYFGPWADPQAALERWLADKDALLAGRVPRSRTQDGSPSLEDLITQFLRTKSAMLKTDDIVQATWDAYADVCDELLEAFGKDRLLTDLLPEDFEALRGKWAERWGPVRLANEINRARVVFNYAKNNRMISLPIVFGEGFKRPSLKVLRLNRAKKGPRMFEAEELRRIIQKAAQPMKAMILLGINAALGNADIAKLELSAIDLKTGWLTYPRGKTGIARRCSLWPETLKAINEWLSLRPAAKDPANFLRVFITVRGNGWDKNSGDRAISHECRKLLDELKIDGNRNFYALRHTFETVGGESRDQVAVDAIMGHVDAHVRNAYRERISDERLKAATDFVRNWLFEKPAKSKGAGKMKGKEMT